MDSTRAPAPITTDDASRHARRAGYALLLWLGIGVANTLLWLQWMGTRRSGSEYFGWFTGLALLQVLLGIVALVEGIRGWLRRSRGAGYAALGVIGVIGAGLGWTAGIVVAALGSSGGAWGRPLRVRGRQLHPELRLGSDWTRGVEPDAAGLEGATRAALEALWLHDAQKEHASVPAFARISWLLAAVGAPPELHRGAQRAALEEIDHAERCFALAAGYGGRRHTVEPMPELLLEGAGRVDDPLTTLAYESVTDGCQLEDFNADVAARCAAVCEEPVTRAVLQQIAREERSHAEFSWRLVQWVAEVDPGRARAAIERAMGDLDRYPRPTAVSEAKRALVAAADAQALRRHGRLPDEEWAAAWAQRLRETRRRLADLLDGARAAA